MNKNKEPKPNLNVDFNVKTDKKAITINGIQRQELLEKYSLKDMEFYEAMGFPRKIENMGNIDISIEKIERIINEIFKCTICQFTFTEPVNFKNCLHKFCKTCVDSYLLKPDEYFFKF